MHCGYKTSLGLHQLTDVAQTDSFNQNLPADVAWRDHFDPNNLETNFVIHYPINQGKNY